MTGLALDLQLQRGDFHLHVRHDVPPSGVTAIFGRSGTGKSSLLRAIAGLDPVAGTITFNGERWNAPGFSLPAHRRGAALVFQDARLFPHLSVAGNLAYATRRAPGGKGGADFDGVVEILDLARLLPRNPATLSGGERQRVAIGRALLSSPRLLMLDEPLSALDTARRHEILPLLERLRDRTALPILYVSHALDEVARLATHVVALDAGRVLTAGPVTEVLSDPALFPMLAGEETGAVLSARVTRHDPSDGLSELDLGGGTVAVPLLDSPVGTQVRLRIRARDVLIARERPAAISALNILAAEVCGAGPAQGPSIDLQLRIGDQTILARLTRRSVAALDLQPGTRCFAILKTVALVEGGLGA